MARLLSFDAYELGVIEGISNRRNDPTYFEEALKRLTLAVMLGIDCGGMS